MTCELSFIELQRKCEEDRRSKISAKQLAEENYKWHHSIQIVSYSETIIFLMRIFCFKIFSVGD